MRVIGETKTAFITDDGVVRQPRMPKQNARQRASGAGVRSPGTHGFQVTTIFDRERGRVDVVAYRASRGQGSRTTEQPAAISGGWLPREVVKACNERANPSTGRSPVARRRQRRNRRAKDRRAAAAHAAGLLNGALVRAHEEERAREARINAAAQREWQLAFQEMAARLGNAVR